MLVIREESQLDIPTVRALNIAAFGQETEADIVDAIRTDCADAVSLVALDGQEIVGHIFFSPVLIECENETVQAMGLGPMAVWPQQQRQGFGSLMVKAGIEAMRQLGCPLIVVLGHPDFYPRFGFRPASRLGLRCQWPGVPDEAFMTLVLDEQATTGVSGTVWYRQEFDQAL